MKTLITSMLVALSCTANASDDCTTEYLYTDNHKLIDNLYQDALGDELCTTYQQRCEVLIEYANENPWRSWDKSTINDAIQACKPILNK